MGSEPSDNTIFQKTIKIWVNLITTEPCSPEAWNHGLC